MMGGEPVSGGKLQLRRRQSPWPAPHYPPQWSWPSRHRNPSGHRSIMPTPPQRRAPRVAVLSRPKIPLRRDEDCPPSAGCDSLAGLLRERRGSEKGGRVSGTFLSPYMYLGWPWDVIWVGPRGAPLTAMSYKYLERKQRETYQVDHGRIRRLSPSRSSALPLPHPSPFL